MTPQEERVSPQISRGGGSGRLAALGALALVVVAVIYLLLFSGNGGHNYTLFFETGGQLVSGNEVLIGGQPVGSVDEVELTDDGQARVEVTVDRQLHEGTSAVIRATSLSGIANRYISVTPGPDNAPALDDGAAITQVDTTTPVDLDQLFNALREPERKGLQDIIQGSATVYAGRAEDANETYKYLSPGLSATEQLLSELNRDQRALTDFLVNGSRVVTAVAERRDDLSGLVSNTNEALGAIASENRNFDRALQALPPALRQANTTFSNLRLALDDLDPLVATAKPATKDLAPFLRRFKPVVKRSVPVFHDLGRAVNRKGKNNDLADAVGKLVSIQNQASTAAPASTQALVDSQDTVTNLRPYAPELTSGISNLNRIAAYYDADGHYLRAEPAGLNVFTYASPNLVPIDDSQIYTDYGPPGTINNQVFRRCPGGITQPILGSNPFSNPPILGGATSGPPPADCDAADVPQGP
jgi:phospholipid/cholesterol/gamma-HCH transport system substrate-binding protein